MVAKVAGRGAPARSKNAPVPEGIIRAEESYTLAEFCRRVGWKRAAYRAARKRGLRIIMSGSRLYILGRDWFDFLAREAAGAGSSSESAGG